MTQEELARLADLLRIYQLGKAGGAFIPFPVRKEAASPPAASRISEGPAIGEWTGPLLVFVPPKLFSYPYNLTEHKR